MAVSDPIADFLTCIRNANAKLFEKLDVPASKIKGEILEVMKKEGYIVNYKLINDRKQGVFRIYMKYSPQKKRVIRGIERVSSPGYRIYKDTDSLPKVRSGLGVAIMSTSKGLMTSKEAGKLGVGGEVICYVW